MPTADQVLAAAASQLGYYRKPGTATKFGDWYGLSTGQWCAMFVSWCAEQAGATAIIPRHSYTPSGVAWFKARGQWHAGLGGVRRGDIVYFDWPGDGVNRVSHVGIVELVNANGTINTIEGNTSGTVGGDQRNGGLCARKVRSTGAVGYGRPAYSSTKRVVTKVAATLAAIAAALGIAVSSIGGAPTTAPDQPLPPGVVLEVPDSTIVEPSDPVENVAPPAPVAPSPAPSSSGVADQQSTLNRLGYGLVVDGIRGPRTTAATADVQRRCGIAVDGVYGPQTASCVARLLALAPKASATVAGQQRALNGVGYSLVVDGIRGAKTIAATIAVQGRCGIARDGIYGPRTTACVAALKAPKVRTLGLGSVGDDVAAVQRKVGVRADRVFGPVTKAAVVRYQRAHRLTADGLVGPITRRSLGL